MALYDVTRDLAAGERPPFEDDCVYVLRASRGNITVKVDSGVTSAEAGRLLSALGESLREGCAPAGTDSGTVAEQKGLNFGGVDPDSVTEDLVRWQGGFAAYKQPEGRWWWVKWRADTGERWGLSGPLMGAVETKKGPFDNFDETLASLLLFRSQKREEPDEQA